MRSVSERASALAGDQIAGAAGATAPTAKPETDFRKSRRFMRGSNANVKNGFGAIIARFVPNLNRTLRAG
jgi:hypothetical protein